jgi:hypothetical protein
LQSIDYAAFYQAGLTDITFEGTEPPAIHGEAFSGCIALSTIHIPKGSLEAYQPVLSDLIGIPGSYIVKEPISLSGATLALPAYSYDFTGSQITPAVIVEIDSLPLAEGSDYTVSYDDNINPGTATVTVTAKADSDYEGSASVQFTIKPLALPSTGPAVGGGTSPTGPAVDKPKDTPPTGPAVHKPPVYTSDKAGRPVLTVPPTAAKPLYFTNLSVKALAVANKTWTGKQIKGGLAVRVSYVAGGKVYTKVLKQNVDYSLSKFGKNKNIGKGTVTITGKAGSVYAGSKVLGFKIVPKRPTALKLKAGKTFIRVSFKKVSTAQKVKTYRIEYRIKGAAKWKSKTVKVKLTGKAAKEKIITFALKKLNSKKTYQVRVYAYKGSYKGYPTGLRRVKVK